MVGLSWGYCLISSPITIGFLSRICWWLGSHPNDLTLQLNLIYCRSSSMWKNQQNPSNYIQAASWDFAVPDNASKAYINPSYLQSTVDTLRADSRCKYFGHCSHRNMETSAGPNPPYASTSRRECIGSTNASSVLLQQLLIRQKRSWTRGRYPQVTR